MIITKHAANIASVLYTLPIKNLEITKVDDYYMASLEVPDAQRKNFDDLSSFSHDGNTQEDAMANLLVSVLESISKKWS